MGKTFLGATVLTIVLALSGASASHCATWSTSATSIDGHMIVVPVGNLYLYVDGCQVPPGDPTGWPPPGIYGEYVPFPGWDHDGDGDADGCLFSNWFYEESNGIPGLQRGDDVVDDTCHGLIDADTFVF